MTLALLCAIKGGGSRAFSRWLTRDSMALFPQVPERTRLARLFKTHTAWTARFLAAPTVLGVADSYGMEWIHPMREGRSPSQIGNKGKSNHRWIVGGKLCFILNQWGLICAWDCATANVHDTHFQPLIAQCDDQRIVLTDTGFHAAAGDPPHRRELKGLFPCHILSGSVLFDEEWSSDAAFQPGTHLRFLMGSPTRATTEKTL